VEGLAGLFNKMDDKGAEQMAGFFNQMAGSPQAAPQPAKPPRPAPPAAPASPSVHGGSAGRMTFGDLLRRFDEPEQLVGVLKLLLQEETNTATRNMAMILLKTAEEARHNEKARANLKMLLAQLKKQH
jgi:hypothetical protein